MTEQDSIDDSIEESTKGTTYKIIFVGDNMVGKTAIISQIMDNPLEEYEITIGIDFVTKNIKFRGQNIKIQIWDTNGQEKYKALIPSYVRNSSIAFLVYDISSKTSFDNIPNWITFIRTVFNSTLVLCGNKIDLEKYREVKKEEGETFAKMEGLSFFEVSAKTGDGIKNMFYNAVADLPSFDQSYSNKESLVNDLLQENIVENIQEDIKTEEQKQSSAKNINVNGQSFQVKNGRNKLKKCGC